MPYKSTEKQRLNATRYYYANRESKQAYQRGHNPEYCRRPATRYIRFLAEAKRREKEVSISLEQYLSIISDNCCFYCTANLPETGSGLDRLDHKLGYVSLNVVPCCRVCNETKGKLESAGFIYPRTVELMEELVCLRNS